MTSEDKEASVKKLQEVMTSEEKEASVKKLQEVIQSGYAFLGSTIKESNAYPTGESYCNYSTYAPFNLLSKEFSNKANKLMNSILSKQGVNVRFNTGDEEHAKEKIVDCNDSMLENVNILLDIMSGFRKPQQTQLPQTNTNSNVNKSGNISSWNKQPTIERIAMGSKVLVAAKNITRPQINFKDPIDNSPERLWVPKIKVKPNALKPLNLLKEYDFEGKEMGYKHPYEFEINSFNPEIFLKVDSKPLLLSNLESVPLTMVETEKQLEKLVKHLCEVSEIGIDVEHHSYRTYQGITCLLQISTLSGGDFVVDALSLRDHLYKLNEAFTNPNILKILHGADSDVIWLQRDLGLYIVGMWDNYRATKLLGMAGSLAYTCQHYCNVTLDKKYQLADWRIRPLPDFLIQYARMDSHYLIYIWRKMKEDLIKVGNGKTHLLESAFTQSQQICLQTYVKPVINDDSHLLKLKSKKHNLNSRQMEALKCLYKWRDTLARNEDESTKYVLPEHMLLPLAATLPRELQGILALCHPVPPLVRQHLNAIHKIILKCREIPLRPTDVLEPSQVSITGPIVEDLFPHLEIQDNSFKPNEPTAFAGLVKIRVSPTFKMIKSSLFPEEKPCKINTKINRKSLFTPISRYLKYRKVTQEAEWAEYHKQKSKLEALEKVDREPPIYYIEKPKVDHQCTDLVAINQKSDNTAREEVVKNDCKNVFEKHDDKLKKPHNKNWKKNFQHNDQQRHAQKRKANDGFELNKARASNKTDFKQFDYKNADFKKFKKVQPENKKPEKEQKKQKHRKRKN